MPATWDQLEYLAMAICPILGSMNAGPGQPFRVDLYPSSLPLPLISGLAPDSGWAPLPGGPGGDDITGAELVVVRDRGKCKFSITVKGNIPGPNGTKVPATRATEWYDLLD